MATTQSLPSTSTTLPADSDTPVIPRRAAGQPAVLTPPPIFSIFRAYQPSALRNVIEVTSDDEDSAEPCTGLANAASASASTSNSPSPNNLSGEGPSSDEHAGPNAAHADAPVDKENVPAPPAAVNDAAPYTSDAPPPSQSSTVTRFVSVRPLRPIVPLPKYRTAYRRFLRGKDLANTKSTQATLIAQRLNNRVFKTQSETSRNLLRGIKRKWTPTTAEFVPNKRPETVAGRGTPAERPDGESFSERGAYEVPEKMRGYRVPDCGTMRTVRSPMEYLELHSLALKREMPKKGTKGAKRAQGGLRTTDLLTPVVDLRWQLMQMDVDADGDEPWHVSVGCQASPEAIAEAAEETSAENPLDAACVEETGRLLPKAKIEDERRDTGGKPTWDTMDYREPMVIDD
ncbi:hypothetical protein C8Q73DRAFT_493899 [Cubamyces lactineus]|nr:hypothetical protein C8Q73DRAFT_493899 [Cubamyces lactineus]